MMRVSPFFSLLFIFAACRPSIQIPDDDANTPESVSENTNEACSNGKDDDRDGATDCEDTECRVGGLTACTKESDLSACYDDIDNDLDGLENCDDPDCAAFCENTDETCSDGISQDDDPFADCEDFECLFGCNVTVCGAEKSEADCTDGIDNDGDGNIDCADSSCRSCAPSCDTGDERGEDSIIKCTDGIDNDEDGKIDCQDSECPFVDGVEGCNTGDENTEEKCSDGIDNDNDPYIDCQDRDCQGVGECGEGTDAKCSDGIDNDENSFTDCDDFGCKFGCDVTVCGSESSMELCTNGLDDDGDGDIDCQDRGCQSCVPECGGDAGGENTVELCTNGIDDDMDGGADCLDTQCWLREGVTGCNTGEENTDEKCSDGIDNDNDPFADCLDFNCAGLGDCTEDDEAKCSDGISNDGDPFVDCEDRDCEDLPICAGEGSSENTTAACTDASDNDDDGSTDCDDFDCSQNAAVQACPTPVTTTVSDIQDENSANYVGRPLASGDLRVKVRIEGAMVTSAPVQVSNKFHFFIQDVFPPADTRFSGVEVVSFNSTAPAFVVGDVVNLWGFVEEQFGNTQVVFGDAELVSSGGTSTATVVDTTVFASEADAESYEGVFVRIDQVEVIETGVASTTSVNEDFRVRESSSSSGDGALVSGVFYYSEETEPGDNFGSIFGFVRYSWDKFRIAPRSSADLLEISGSEDSDGDGLSDAQEADIGTSVSVADTDGDGDNDGLEVGDFSAPNDSDCDGVIDALESSIEDNDGDGTADEVDVDNNDGPAGDADNDGTLNADDPDDDGDGVCDPGVGAPITDVCTSVGDNCPSVANAAQENGDGDALGDACDIDRDNDDVCEGLACGFAACVAVNDNCEDLANTSQDDFDADGQGDLCDADADGDAVCDAAETVEGECSSPTGSADNCLLLSNPNQSDADDDTLGDECDADDDNDGICDPGVQEGEQGCSYVGGLADNCPRTPNPDQADTDTDGVGDACEGLSSVPMVGEMVVNEILADPFGAGDANGDGVVSPLDDEFIELVNVSTQVLDFEGCTLSDENGVVHEFLNDGSNPDFTLDPKQAVIVFAGGSPVGDFAGNLVFVSSSLTLSMNNNGDVASLHCDDILIDEMSFADGVGKDNQSVNRAVDGDPSSEGVKHTEVSGAGAAVYSPGTCANGDALSVCLP